MPSNAAASALVDDAGLVPPADSVGQASQLVQNCLMFMVAVMVSIS